MEANEPTFLDRRGQLIYKQEPVLVFTQPESQGPAASVEWRLTMFCTLLAKLLGWRKLICKEHKLFVFLV